eukprot:4658478-Pyramimonas_sp.AAC.1
MAAAAPPDRHSHVKQSGHLFTTNYFTYFINIQLLFESTIYHLYTPRYVRFAPAFAPIRPPHYLQPAASTPPQRFPRPAV